MGQSTFSFTAFWVQLKNFYRLYSTQIMAVLAAISVAEGYFQAFSYFLPDDWFPYFSALFAIAAILARMLPQPETVADINQKVVVAEFKKNEQ